MKKQNFPTFNVKGAALIALVAAILVFSVLSAAIIPMISSSSEQGIATNFSTKAYLLAESGYRYAASQFLHAGTSEQVQNQAIEDLGGEYTLNNNDGSFNLEVYSYFYELTAPVNGESQFTAHAPGNFPGQDTLEDDPGAEVVLGRDLKIKIGSQTYSLSSGSSPVTGFDDRVSFNIQESLSSHPAGSLVYPVAEVDTGENTALSEGGNLIYKPGDADMFPLRNGNIQINGRTLSYQFNDRSNNRFIDVRASAPPTLNNFDLMADTEIILTRYVRLHATGRYGSGNLEAQRLVVYHTPLPISESRPQQHEYSDPFDSKQNWSDTGGTSTISDFAGTDRALKVDASVSGTDQKSALTTFSPADSSPGARAIDFNASQRSTRGYLSYDIQVKIGYENTTAPALGYFPTPPLLDAPLPAYVGAGLSFRLDNNNELFSNNGYGISIVRGNSSIVDDIPDELLPLDNQRAIVLWRQTGNGAQRTWLAYKRVVDMLIYEDNEERTGNEFVDSSSAPNLWDLEPTSLGLPSQQRAGSIRNWYYGRGSTHTYNWMEEGVPVQNDGILQSRALQLPVDSPEISLTFWSWHETEPGTLARPLGSYDLKQIRVTTRYGTVLRTYTIDGAQAPAILSGPEDGWYHYKVGDLKDFAGQEIRIQFRFDTVDAINNDYEGWYVDDIQLSAKWPVQLLQDATLALNLKEAMVVRFNNGSSQIHAGDQIYGGSRGTRGTVLIPPLLENGSWGGSPLAEGTLLLNRTTALSETFDPFVVGEELYVVGGTGLVEVESWDNTNDTKANIIQVYVANKDGSGTGGNGNPLDRNTEPYGRIGNDPLKKLTWPPFINSSGDWTDDDGNWTPSEDYFQQIEWDEINTAAGGVSSIPFKPNGQDVIEHAIIQSYHEQLKTPDYPGIYEASEVGLHSFGDGAENIYFDDFGIRLNIYETDILPTPIQR